MLEKKETVYPSYIAIIVYYLLPRMTVSSYSGFWNQLMASRSLFIFIITVLMFMITYQKTHSHKWEKTNLPVMVLGAYVLYFMVTICQFLPFAF